jgi:hypothetical protein
MSIDIFYAWQSDLHLDTNKYLIRDALKAAIKKLNRTDNVLESERPNYALQQDTTGVPGMPSIADTILKRIDGCRLFVADISPINLDDPQRRLTPNPNVMFELGYAFARHGDVAVLAVVNTAYLPEGSLERLPFDIRGKRPIQFDLPVTEDKQAIKQAMKKLSDTLEDAITTALKEGGRRQLIEKLDQINPLILSRFAGPHQPLQVFLTEYTAQELLKLPHLSRYASIRFQNVVLTGNTFRGQDGIVRPTPNPWDERTPSGTYQGYEITLLPAFFEE